MRLSCRHALKDGVAGGSGGRGFQRGLRITMMD